MQEFYDITVAGVKRSLPIVPISDTMSIAGFVIFGDTEVWNPAPARWRKSCRPKPRCW